ncbi:MAG TPA: exodeoxyribonuclease VII small subunit [Candidatus Saccharimonadales bacterium]|nr:exodeoxyribonuclease VII small subunit [Candidatus Saccharimonadales bacterium]
MKNDKVNFTQLSQELELIISKLSSGDTDIDSAVSEYEKGIAIVSKLEAYLKDTKNKISKVKAPQKTGE